MFNIVCEVLHNNFLVDSRQPSAFFQWSEYGIVFSDISIIEAIKRFFPNVVEPFVYVYRKLHTIVAFLYIFNSFSFNTYPDKTSHQLFFFDGNIIDETIAAFKHSGYEETETDQETNFVDIRIFVCLPPEM